MKDLTNISFELLKERNIFIIGEVNREMSYALTQALIYLNGQSKDPIHIYISGPGGSIYEGLAIIDIIKSIKAPVYTYCTGLAASMSAMIFLAGDKRYMFLNSYLMLHQPLAGVQGQASDIELLSRQLSSLKSRLYNMVASNSNLQVKKIADLADRDCYIDADMAFKFKLCDEILKGVKNEK